MQPELLKREFHAIGFSGGKDSSALLLRLLELHPDRKWHVLITPTGDELPDMVAHWRKFRDLVEGLGHAWIELRHPGGDLVQLSKKQRILPSVKLRWCTRMLKIVPYRGYLLQLKEAERKAGYDTTIHSYVGLRADESEREGMYGDGITYHFPMQEWGWGLAEVWKYLDDKGFSWPDHLACPTRSPFISSFFPIEIPERSDCGSCPEQRVGQWYRTWLRFPDSFAIAEDLETEIQGTRGDVTIRSKSRDKWPPALRDLRAEFEALRELLKDHPGLRDYTAQDLRECIYHIDIKKLRRWRWLLRAAEKEQTRLREEKTGCRVCSL